MKDRREREADMEGSGYNSWLIMKAIVQIVRPARQTGDSMF